MTVGLSRNNPWNLMPGIAWDGSTVVDDGPLQFETPLLGMRAGIKNCYTQQSEGNNTPLKFVTKYAPPPNPTAQYLQNVCDWTGFEMSQTLDFHEETTMITWAKAVFRQEQGVDNGITTEEIQAGIVAANE